MQQFALDLYTPEFADSFVLWRTDSSRVGTRYVRGVDFVLYNSRYVIRVYDGSSYGYVGYIVGNNAVYIGLICRLMIPIPCFPISPPKFPPSATPLLLFPTVFPRGLAGS